jgi:hypothetical protein
LVSIGGPETNPLKDSEEKGGCSWHGSFPYFIQVSAQMPPHQRGVWLPLPLVFSFLLVSYRHGKFSVNPNKLPSQMYSQALETAIHGFSQKQKALIPFCMKEI